MSVVRRPFFYEITTFLIKDCAKTLSICRAESRLYKDTNIFHKTDNTQGVLNVKVRPKISLRQYFSVIILLFSFINNVNSMK